MAESGAKSGAAAGIAAGADAACACAEAGAEVETGAEVEPEPEPEPEPDTGVTPPAAVPPSGWGVCGATLSPCALFAALASPVIAGAALAAVPAFETWACGVGLAPADAAGDVEDAPGSAEPAPTPPSTPVAAPVPVPTPANVAALLIIFDAPSGATEASMSVAAGIAAMG
ncbi:MAG: hypothetical protein ACN6PR_02940, partial [Achromobacter sp.]